VLRDSRVVYESSVSTLRRFKDDVKEVKHGFECGLTIENFNDIKVGDVIETFEMTQIQAEL
jgi:translation initiation factor IF-2